MSALRSLHRFAVMFVTSVICLKCVDIMCRLFECHEFGNECVCVFELVLFYHWPPLGSEAHIYRINTCVCALCSVLNRHYSNVKRQMSGCSTWNLRSVRLKRINLLESGIDVMDSDEMIDEWRLFEKRTTQAASIFRCFLNNFGRLGIAGGYVHYCMISKLKFIFEVETCANTLGGGTVRIDK